MPKKNNPSQFDGKKFNSGNGNLQMNYIFKKSVSRKESRIDLFFQGAPKSVKLLTHLGIGNNSWSFQNSNSLKNW